MKVNKTASYLVEFRITASVTLPTNKGMIGRIFGKAEPLKIPVKVPVSARIKMTAGHAGQLRFYLNMLAKETNGTISGVTITELGPTKA